MVPAAAMVLEEMCDCLISKWRRLTVLPLPPFTRILPQQLYYYYYKLFLPELTWKELSWQKNFISLQMVLHH